MRDTTHPLTRRQALAATAGLALLGGCSTALTTTEGGVPIDMRHSARGQDSRALFLILHYTVADLPLAIKVLTEQDVSAHYLLSDETPPRIYRLVPEHRRAWHSGQSGWKGHRQLNASSIGIEIVHPGFRLGPAVGGVRPRVYPPFPAAQIDALILLVQDIVQRHQIRPERILGHGEVTPAYKEDPGPTFPWRRLSELGITPPWPDAARVLAQRAVFEATPPDAAWWQTTLVQHGYELAPSGLFDEATKNVLASFQMRYRPSNYAGQADPETAALLHVLTTTPTAPAPGSASAPPQAPTPTPAPAPVRPAPARSIY